MKRTGMTLLAVIIAVTIFAAPASPSLFQELLPDGSSIELQQKGDEYFSWKENAGGDVVIKNRETGYYEFAVLKTQNGAEILAPSGIKADSGNGPSFSKTLLENHGMKRINPDDLKRLHRLAKEKRKFPMNRKPFLTLKSNNQLHRINLSCFGTFLFQTA
jgi:hypothetical protein